MVDSWTPSPDRLFDLSGRVAVVTGATGVLGGAMARGLARAGARVGVLGRRKERAEEVAAEVKSRGGEALALPADVLKREQLEAARDAVLERWGRVDILVNAAGGNVPAARSARMPLSLGCRKSRCERCLTSTSLGPCYRAKCSARRWRGGRAPRSKVLS